MRAIGVVGYKKTGKTTLVVALARELTGRGYRVATIKHASEGLDLPEGDTARHRTVSEEVGAVSPEESAIFLRGARSLEEILSHLNADFVLIEGFKEEKTFPRVVCLSGRKEDKVGRADEALFDGLSLCAVGQGSNPETGVPVFDPERDLGAIADLVEEKAFKLPNLNCGGCGYETCYGLARAIVEGKRSVADCVSLHPSAEIRIDGALIAINPFIGRMVARTIEGMLSELKGFKKGTIEIKIG